MKIAVSSIAWPIALNDQVAKLMREFGIGGVEMIPGRISEQHGVLTPAAAKETRKYWEGHDISIPSMQSLLYGAPHSALFEGPALQAKLRENLKQIFAIAAALGATRLVFGSPKNRRRGELPFETALTIAAEFFQGVGDDASEAGVMLCIEHVPPEMECDFVNTVDEGIRLVKAIANPNIALHLDSAAIRIAGEDFSSAITKASGTFVHFHASERALAPLGSGFVNHAAAGAALKKIGYGGWVSIEMREPNEPLPALRRAFEVATASYI